MLHNSLYNGTHYEFLNCFHTEHEFNAYRDECILENGKNECICYNLSTLGLSRWLKSFLVDLYFQHGCWCLHGDTCMKTSSIGNIFRVTGPLCGEFTGHRWIPRTKASDAAPRLFLWSAPGQTDEQTIETLMPSRSLWRHCDVEPEHSLDLPQALRQHRCRSKQLSKLRKSGLLLTYISRLRDFERFDVKTWYP